MSLHTLNENSELLQDIFDKEIIVYEDIQGSKIFVNWDGENFTIKPKSMHGEEINLVDLAMQKFYNKAINFFYSLDDRVKSLMPKKWYFCFEYFPDSQPANIKYDKVPKNNLILTGICKGKKFNYSIEELIEYANLMGTDCLPVIFKGKLNQKQIEAIKYFLNTSQKDLDYVFGEKNFAFFFYKLLNPKHENSFLMDADFQENVQKIVIMCDDSKSNFEILNPLYKRVSAANTTQFSEIYSLILLNFLDFCQTLNLNDFKLKGNKRDKVYINLICLLYNKYMNDTIEDIKEFEITIPKFFDKNKFKINTKLITNKLTRKYIQEDDKFEYIFKVILSSFQKPKKKEIGYFNESTLKLFNNYVESINKEIDNHLNKLSDEELRKSGLVDFDKFYNLKYDVDSEGEVYPEIWDEFEDPGESKKKGIKKKDIDKDDFDLEI